MNTLKILLLSAFIVLASGCGYNAGVKTEEAVSFLYFTGDAEGVEVSIDNAAPFIVSQTGISNQYRVSPGKHLIIITKNGQVVVKREVLLGDGHEKEFFIP
ncbi:hypothetical protein [Shewanella sp.]|uniref:hypothetical protein n=1 Tax=Shewanella sp. TaxID=50422 RepID=UPI0040538560